MCRLPAEQYPEATLGLETGHAGRGGEIQGLHDAERLKHGEGGLPLRIEQELKEGLRDNSLE